MSFITGLQNGFNAFFGNHVYVLAAIGIGLVVALVATFCCDLDGSSGSSRPP